MAEDVRILARAARTSIFGWFPDRIARFVLPLVQIVRPREAQAFAFRSARGEDVDPAASERHDVARSLRKQSKWPGGLAKQRTLELHCPQRRAGRVMIAVLVGDLAAAFEVAAAQ